MENEDKFLHEYRRDPAPGYSRRLRESLRDQEELRQSRTWRPMVAAAATLAVAVALFAFPNVRVWAQSVLDLFRVRNFVAVSFDPARMDRLRALGQDHSMLVFDRQVIQEPGKPVVQPSPAMASAAAGFTVQTPAYLPRGLVLDTVSVTGEGRARLGASTAKLRDLLTALDLRDVAVPAALDGQNLTVHTYPAVSEQFHSERHQLAFIQSRSPEVSLPTGVDLAQLGEIGLRILGLDAAEAERMARSVDWRSTLLVPVPANASTFSSVTVQGNRGLLITTREGAPGEHRRAGSVVLWTAGDRVFALNSTLGSEDLMQVAESIR